MNQVLAFTLEIIMIITYAYFGMTRPWSLPMRLLSTILIISITILLWALFAAPKSEYRLKIPYLLFFRTLMFVFAAFILFKSGNKNYAIIVSLFILITQTISYFTEQ